jgi:hypothetical protein
MIMVSGHIVRISAAVPARIDMDDDIGEPWMDVEKRMAHFFGNAVTFAGGQILIDNNI